MGSFAQPADITVAAPTVCPVAVNPPTIDHEIVKNWSVSSSQAGCTVEDNSRATVSVYTFPLVVLPSP